MRVLLELLRIASIFSSRVRSKVGRGLYLPEGSRSSEHVEHSSLDTPQPGTPGEVFVHRLTMTLLLGTMFAFLGFLIWAIIIGGNI